jgi:hypothetical protein
VKCAFDTYSKSERFRLLQSYLRILSSATSTKLITKAAKPRSWDVEVHFADFRSLQRVMSALAKASKERNVTILITGSSCNIGSQVVNLLAGKGRLGPCPVRNPSKKKMLQGIDLVEGDMSQQDVRPRHD